MPALRERAATRATAVWHGKNEHKREGSIIEPYLLEISAVEAASGDLGDRLGGLAHVRGELVDGNVLGRLRGEAALLGRKLDLVVGGLVDTDGLNKST